MKIICIPYAGGFSGVYTKWKNYISQDVEIIAPELSGRGIRSREAFYLSIQEAADDIFQIILKENIDQEFVIFGHSMGCFIAYELYLKITKHPNLNKKLVHIFMSGSYAPHLNNDKKHTYELHKLDNDELKKKVSQLGGTPKEIFESSIFDEYFLPIIRADYYITETYISNQIVPFTCSCTVYNGLDDDLTEEDLMSWKAYSPIGFNIKNFPGSHFFINENCEEVLKHLNLTLKNYLVEKEGINE